MSGNEEDSNGQLIDRATWQRIRKPAISAFIITHLILIFFFMEKIGPITERLEPFRRYVFFVGLDQTYRVFAPKPRDMNVHLIAVVTHANGAVEVWEYPRMERLTTYNVLFKERYRKFANDVVVWEQWKMFLPDVARYVARVTNEANNPPRLVSLIRYSASIPPPAEGLNKPLPPQSDMTPLITYSVQPSDLE